MTFILILCYIIFFRFYTYASKSKDNLVSLGFPSFTIEDFHDTVSSENVVISLSLSVSPSLGLSLPLSVSLSLSRSSFFW